MVLFYVCMNKRAAFFLCVVLTVFLIPATVFSVEKELSSDVLMRSVEKAGAAEGNPLDNDTEEKLKRFSKRYASGRGGIRFAGSDAPTIKALTERTGFFFKKNDDGWFDHMDMVTVVDKNGVIYRQIYGIRASGDELVRTLRELVTGASPGGRPVTLIEKIKYFCYKYDKASGRYVFDYALVLGMFLEFIVIAAIVIAMWGKGIAAFFKRRSEGEDS